MKVQLAPLVKRELELETAERVLAGARAGSGGGLLFEGPAGIGKSSLLAATRTAAGSELRILSARGSSVGSRSSRARRSRWLCRPDAA